MSVSATLAKRRREIKLTAVILALLGLVVLVYWFNDAALEASRQNFDRMNLHEFFVSLDYNNDVLVDTFLIPARGKHGRLVNLELLGLQRDRFAYLAKRDEEVIAVAVPATADDGFNGTIDLLVATDMFGRINAARVIQDIDTQSLYGVVGVIESTWMEGFTGKAMRDVRRASWQTISAGREYDQFVGASITPKAVAERIYNAMVFFQSNRIELMRGE